MKDKGDNFWGEEIFRYTRAQAIEDGVLVDLTAITDEHGQVLCRQAGFKIPMAITRTAWAKTVEAGGTWKPASGEGEVLQLQGAQSVTGRLWDLLQVLHQACRQAADTDRVDFQVVVEVDGEGHHQLVRLWALCGPGDESAPVMTVMLVGED